MSYLKNTLIDGSLTVSGDCFANNIEYISNKVTELTSACTNTQYPGAKCIYDIVGNINNILDEINGEVI